MEPWPGLPSLTPTSALSLERRRFTRSPHSREPSSTSAPSGSTATPTAEEGGEAPGGREGGPKGGSHPPPGPRPHRTLADGRPRPPHPRHSRTHTAHAPQGLNDVTRQRYARRRCSQRGGPGLLVFASPWATVAGKLQTLSPQRLRQRKLRAQTERPLVRPLGQEGGANLSGTRWLRPPGPGPQRLSAEVSLVQVELILVSFRQYEIKSQTGETAR